VLRSFVRGPLEPHIAGFAEQLLRQSYTRPRSSSMCASWRICQSGDHHVEDKVTKHVKHSNLKT